MTLYTSQRLVDEKGKSITVTVITGDDRALTIMRGEQLVASIRNSDGKVVVTTPEAGNVQLPPIEADLNIAAPAVIGKRSSRRKT